MSDIITNAVNGPILDANIPGIGNFLRADSLLWNKIFLQADERDFLQFSEANALWAVTEDNTIRWHEDGFIQNNITIASFTGGASAGATAVITIAAADHTNSGTKSPFNANLETRVNNTGMFIQSKSTATPNAHTITVVPTDATVVLNTILVAGQTVIPIDYAFGERTGYTESDFSVPVLFSEKTAILKNKITISGTAASIKLKMPQAYSGGVYEPFEADYKLFINHKLNISQAALIGSGKVVSDGTNSVQLVKGVIPQIQERGTDYPYYGNLTLEDMYSWTKILNRERAGKEHDVKMGINAQAMLEKNMTDVMKNGARMYLDNMNGSTSKRIRMIDFGYDGFMLNGYMFYTKAAQEFNNPVTTGAPGQQYPWSFMITPVSMVKDAVTGTAGYAVQLGYKSAPGPHGQDFTRKFQLRIGGDSSSTPNSEIDEVNFRYLTEFGVAVALANQAIYARKADLS